jgi:predicted PhzF superfamily epimerase YddE/YHI9
MSYFETVLDLETGEQTIRQYTQAEIVEVEKTKASRIAEQAIRDAEQKVKDDAKTAVLTKLGLTADEVRALLG